MTRKLLILALVLGCGSPPPAVEMPAAAWRKVDDGWAKVVPLEAPLVLDDARAGDVLEAVVLAERPGALVVESKAGLERIEVAGARRVVSPIDRAGPVTVRFEGARAALHGLRLRAKDDAGRTRAPRRALLAVIDTLRADALDAETAPELLAAFADGARFTRAYSPASWTLPATASLLTGKAPTELALADGTVVALAPGETTIASDFAARGFHTACISANYTVHHENGFSSGCEMFFVPSILGHGEWPDAEWVLERARRVIEWFPDRDLFLYLHLMDPHDPYRNRETGESVAAPSTGETIESGAVEGMRAAYRGEARHVSRLLAAFLEEAGPFERVVVTADHGEEFLEHGGFKHGPTVYPEVSRVPLLVGGAGIERGEIDRPVSLVGLRRFLASEAATLAGSFGGEVDVVSFVHAAPRFSSVSEEGQAVLFARDLATGEAEADPIGDWLREHHPALDFVDPAGAPRAPAAGEPAVAALRLARRFHGLAAGYWLWVPSAVETLRVEIDGSGEGGWWWGGAAAVRVVPADRDAAAAPPRSGEGVEGSRVVLEIDAPDPFALVFVPASGAGRLRALGVAAIDRLDAVPSEPPRERAAAWRDAGRPPAALEGVEETMKRLRAQGYL